MKAIKYLLTGVVILIVATAASIYLILWLSLPAYDGEKSAHVSSALRLQRDQLGYLTVQAATRTDAAYGLGYAHAQERFFQMDLLRRNASGELSALFGPRAVTTDKARRQHRFRQRAEQALLRLPQAHLAILSQYSQGVNDGLADLTVRPFEYLLLQQQPQPWQNSDSLLVVYSMYLDLQGKLGRDEYAMTVLKQAIPEPWYQFLQQASNEWQAAIDSSAITAVPIPDSPYPELLRQQHLTCMSCDVKDATDIGSNNFAVAGNLTTHGSAIIADDMHLGLRVPGTWYKAQLNWRENGQFRQITGLSLPGTPAIVVGSNGDIAWGFTNSTADWSDLITLTLSDDGKRYLTPEGWQPLQYHYDTIRVSSAEDQPLQLTETQWGPVVQFGNSPAYALRWVGYDPQAVNINLLTLETATSAKAALQLSAAVGIPAQNLVVADNRGNIGWGIIGPIPKRQVSDWDTAQDWSTGQQYWDGYLAQSEQPAVLNPSTNRLWTANARTIGGPMYQVLGNGGYDLGARGVQIKDALFMRQQFDEQTLHQIQLDNRAIFLQRWQQLLLNTLQPDVVQQHQLQDYRQFVVNSTSHAAPDAIGYSLVRAFRQQVLKLQFAPLSAYLEQHGARTTDLKYSLETPMWQLLQQKRADTLPTGYASWQDLLLSAILTSKSTLEQQHGNLSDSAWGQLNTAAIAHPLAAAIPALGGWLNMAPTPLAGDSHMPRVQRPAFGQSQRMVVAPGQEQLGILTIPTGQSGHPLSPFYRADHAYWLNEVALPFLPGKQKYQLTLTPKG